MHYSHQYIDENKFQVAKYFDNGDSQNVSPDDPNYLKWVSDGNMPVVEAKGRFLSVVDGVLIVDPNEEISRQSTVIKNNLQKIDIASIRSLREYVAAKADAPQFLKDHEAEAVIERAKLKTK